MRIAFLCKRKYMSKDVILDRYARLYEIPYQLARLGHEVWCFCFSYQQADEGTWQHEAEPGSLVWSSRTPGKLFFPDALLYPCSVFRELREFKPDIVIGASDIPHVMLGYWLSGRLGAPFVVDLYDNFEGFGQARIPGFVPLFRRAVREAQLVITTSQPLREMVEEVYRVKGKTLTMPSTIDTDVFKHQSKSDCRQALGLPVGGVLIGTAGGLLAERGIGELYQAWAQLSQKYSNAHLVLAGTVDADLPPPNYERVIYLGTLPHADTAKLFSALDVGVIYLRDTPFGRYCFPQKAYEMLACDLPVVGADVGVMPYLLQSLPQAIYQSESSDDLVRALEYQLAARQLIDGAVEGWEYVIARLESHLLQLLT